MICYLDMDGVVTNFTKAACERHNRPYVYPTQWLLAKEWGISDKEFWEPLYGSAFWESLEPTDEAEQIINLVDNIFQGRWRFLSSPNKDPECWTGKAKWIKQYFPKHYKKLTIGAAKEDFAGPNKLLIDDHDENIKKFVDHGGLGILYPRPYNSSKDVTNPLQLIEKTLKVTICRCSKL